VATEHSSVLACCEALEREGVEVVVLPVGPDGRLDLDRFEATVAAGATLASVMAANNEIGVLQDVPALARVCRRHGVLLHTDAAQAAGKVPVDLHAWGVDLASLSAHKLYGPKGIGALYVRAGTPYVRLRPQIVGGGQQRGLRAGTLPTAAIVGFGEAARICRQVGDAERRRIAALRDRLLEGLRARIDGLWVHGTLAARLPGNLFVGIEGVDGAALIEGLRPLALSATAACVSARGASSHVLRALGVPEPVARASLRFGLGRFTSVRQIDEAVERVAAVVNRLRRRPAVRQSARR